ncbi:hypothetical protein J437_LFUL009850, partial [Ladona fulva]
DAAASADYDGSSGASPPAGRRLPQWITPHRYRVCLLTYIEKNFTFEGRVYIDVTVSSDVKDRFSIALHSGDNLNVTEAGVVVRKTSPEDQDDVYSCEATDTSKNHTEVLPVRSHSYENATEIYTIHLGGEGVVAGSNYTLVLPFVGRLKDNLYGYYKSSFKDSVTGEKR